MPPMALAQVLKIPYSEGFMKNRYIGRTFIMPGQAMRQQSSIRLKLNVIRAEFANKIVLLLDDSIVRGTTSKEIIQMERDVGAKKVYFASAAPEIRYPNVYGNMPTVTELIAHEKSVDDVQKSIGVDWLIYQDLPDVYWRMNDMVISGEPKIERFEDSVFTGDYIMIPLKQKKQRKKKELLANKKL